MYYGRGLTLIFSTYFSGYVYELRQLLKQADDLNGELQREEGDVCTEFSISLLENNNEETNRPFAPCASRGTKAPCWRTRDACTWTRQTKISHHWKCSFPLLVFSSASACLALQHGSFVPREWPVVLVETNSCTFDSTWRFGENL